MVGEDVRRHICALSDAGNDYLGALNDVLAAEPLVVDAVASP